MNSSEHATPAGLHVGIIMDGNGRWAMARGQPRLAGHRKGGKVVKQIVEAAPDAGIGILTLYAFSTDNWTRPPREVSGLMRLFRAYLAAETAHCVQSGVRVCVVGRRDRLSPILLRTIQAAEEATAEGRTLLLRIAIDYSSRDAIVAAAGTRSLVRTRDDFARLLERVTNSLPVPEVDLLVRTGGEQRLSDFLLWECAYAELMFEACMWPDFDANRLNAAVREFRRRERRFGGVPQVAAG